MGRSREEGLESYVREILDEIEETGEEGVRKYAQKFDNYGGKLKLESGEWESIEKIPRADKETIDRAMARVREYHEKQKMDDRLEVREGSLYGTLYRPLSRVGLYVPGGKPLPSSLIMSGVPARLAQVDEIVVATPPKEGRVNPYVLYVAKKLGIDELLKLGGIQAIAALAWGMGTEKVDKIFGPGNRYVNEAKRQLRGEVGIDSLAGPSDICVIADGSAAEEAVSLDLASQLEHGEGSKAWLLTVDSELASFCREEVAGAKVEERESLGDCVARANEIAPEHLEIITRTPLELVDSIKNAGAIYLGQFTPVPAADYFLGVNHILPTGGAARFDSVLTVSDFLKPISLAYTGREEFQRESQVGIRLAEIEGLNLHKRALEIRREDEKGD